MKLDQKHINQIKTAFQEMQNKEDLLSIMNFVKPLVYGDKFVPFDLKQLTYYANPELRGKAYKEFLPKHRSSKSMEMSSIKSIQVN